MKKTIVVLLIVAVLSFAAGREYQINADTPGPLTAADMVTP